MKSIRDHLLIIFSQMQPEWLFASLRWESQHKSENDRWNLQPPKLSSREVDRLLYRRCARQLEPALSIDEFDNLFSEMEGQMKSLDKLYGEASVYALLPEYTADVLEKGNDALRCKREQMLEWRACSFPLGQDLLTTAHLAYHDALIGSKTQDFCWPAQLPSNDRRLEEILARGIAENHFHLNGSPRVFDISWICLMNHPERISTYFHNSLKSKKTLSETERNNFFIENLASGPIQGEQDEHWSWSERLFLACWLRAYLYTWMQSGMLPEEEMVDFDCLKEKHFDPDWLSAHIICTKSERRYIKTADLAVLGMPDLHNETNCSRDHAFCYMPADPIGELLCFARKSTKLDEVAEIVETLRFICADGNTFTQTDEKRCCLDYTITPGLARRNKQSPNRILCGERAFLYQAFSTIYERRLTDGGQAEAFEDLLYLYLLLKLQFRKEVIQLNDQMGFKNFALYENRKDLIFDPYPEYCYEAYNTAVNAALQGCVKSHELRITPRDSTLAQFRYIWKKDRDIAHSRGKPLQTPPEEAKLDMLKEPYFYVFHFVKTAMTSAEWTNGGKKTICPRNVTVRNTIRKQALAIAGAMEQYDYLCARIRGIDACNVEIGCRPETFATEFRFLRNFIPLASLFNIPGTRRLLPKLSVTYHAGEDSLGLASGLRAIDEAILYLEMRRGDRIGHAVALGLDPEDFFAQKQYRIIEPKQDHLDDLVWLLFRSEELGVALEGPLRQKMEKRAYRLLHEIFGADRAGRPTLQDYYHSWLLRGDSPERYRDGHYQHYFITNFGGMDAYQQYRYHQIMQVEHEENLDAYRKDPAVAALYVDYHFDCRVKESGLKPEVVPTTPDYIRLLRDIQDKLQDVIMKKGISIECNPSSNLLITPVRRYDQHPIFRFCPVKDDGIRSLHASVNTDDQGVFDTSLENEYALLACSMAEQCYVIDPPPYSEDAIYTYLEHLRSNSISQVFPRTAAYENYSRQ